MLLFLKRATDVVLAATALLLLSPLMVLIATLVRVTSPGPAIFRQIRCGLSYCRRRVAGPAEEMDVLALGALTHATVSRGGAQARLGQLRAAGAVVKPALGH